MAWYYWLIIGLFTGICVSVGSSAAFAFTVVHNPDLMQQFARRLMRVMMSNATSKDKEIVP